MRALPSFFSTFLARSFSWLLHYFFLQLFLTLLSFPILVTHGLALTPLSFLGNLLFSPFIFIYLALSFVIFYAELFGIPSTYCILMLEWLTHLWTAIIQFFTAFTPTAFPVPPLLFFIITTILTFALIATPYTLKQKTAFLCLLLTLTVSGLKLYKPFYNDISSIPRGKKNILLLSLRGTLIALDYKGLPRASSQLEKYIRYTFKSHIAKKYGKTSCDVCILMHPYIKNSLLADTMLSCGMSSLIFFKEHKKSDLYQRASNYKPATIH